MVELSWYERGLVILVGGRLLLGGIARALQQVRLTHTHLEVTGSSRVHMVPWGRLHGARLCGAMLAIAWEPDIVTEVGPFHAPGVRAGQKRFAERLGAAMLRLRERAIVSGAEGSSTSSRPGPAWALLTVYSVLTGLALWAAVSR